MTCRVVCSSGHSFVMCSLTFAFYNLTVLLVLSSILKYIVCLHTRTQPLYGPFSGTAWVSRCPKKSSFGLVVVQGKITEADTPTIRVAATPSELISDPPPSYPMFYARCPSCSNPPTSSWLGTGTKYAGLHIQWRGSDLYFV